MKYPNEEFNQGYEIIASLNINDEAIVLGHSRTNPSPYVTWETNCDRSNGYRSGHYFTNLKSAQRDFENRSESLFQSNMERFQFHSEHRNERSR